MNRLLVTGSVALAVAAGLVAAIGATNPAAACAQVTQQAICVEAEITRSARPPRQPSLPMVLPDYTQAAATFSTTQSGIYVGTGGAESGNEPAYKGTYDPPDNKWAAPGVLAAGAFRLYDPGTPGSPGAPAPALGARAPASPPPVDGGAVAQQLVDRAPFEVATVRTAPQAPDKTYVNLETWLWVPPAQWHEVTASVDSGTASVSIVATPTRVAWEMGDGGTTDCDDAGRAWQTYYTDYAQTGCSYTYEVPSVTATAPDGEFTVSARFFYDISWSCTGNCLTAGGALGEYPAPAGTADLVVSERQSVVISGEYS